MLRENDRFIMHEIFDFLKGILILGFIAIAIRCAIEAIYRVANPDGFARMVENREARRIVFLPYLVAGGVCMIFFPPLGLLIWGIGCCASGRRR